MGHLNIFPTLYVLSRRVQSVKRWMTSVDCKQCGKRTHVFWAEDPVGKFVDYLRQSRPFAGKILSYHISRGYDAQFLLRKFLELRWTPQLIMDGTKILSMIVENLHFLDSFNFLPMALKSMPKSFDLSCKRDIIPTSLTRPTIWTMWALIPNPSTMGQTTCQVMTEPNFWNGTRSKKTKFSAISRSSWPTEWTMSMY